MRARRVVAGLLVSAALVIGGSTSASANIAWCAGDPPVHVDSAAGANLTVNTVVTLRQSEVKYLNYVTADSVTAADGAGGTNVTVNVHLPAGISTAQVTAAVKRYKVSASAWGQGGTTVTLYLHVPA